MPTNLETSSQAIAANVPISYGSPMVILGLVAQWLPSVLQCLSTINPGVTAKQFATSNFDASTQTFNPSVIRHMRPSLIHKARQQGLHHLGRNGIDQISTNALTHAMTAPDELVVGCMAEAAALPPDVTDDIQS